MTHTVLIGLNDIERAASSSSVISFVKVTVHEERQVCLEEVQRWKWSLLDAALSALTPPPMISLQVESKSIFKWLLNDVAAHKLLPRIYDTRARPQGSGKIDVTFAGNTSALLSMDGSRTSVEEVLRMPSEYPLGRRMVSLTIGQRFELLFCRYIWEKQFFLLRALHLVDSGLADTEGDALQASLSDNDTNLASLNRDALLSKAEEVFGSVEAFMETCEFSED